MNLLENVAFDNGAVGPSFAFLGPRCGIFGDIREPQLVRLVTSEFTVHEIARGRGSAWDVPAYFPEVLPHQ